MNTPVGSALKELAELIEAMAEILRAEGYSSWAEKLSTDAEILRRGDPVGCKTYLGHFGGNGSLNDIQVGTTETNAHFEALCVSSQAIARRHYPSLLQQMGWHNGWPITKLVACGALVYLALFFIATNR